MARPRGPHLLAGDEVVVVAGTHGAGLELCRVGAGRRLGDAKRLQAQLAGSDLREVAALLLLAAMPKQRAHDVHLGVALAGGAARGVDLLEDDRGGAQWQARAAILLRDQRGKKPTLGQFGDELARIGLLVFELPPIGAGVFLANLAHGLAQFGVVLAERHDDAIAALANAICTIGHRPLLLGSPSINSEAAANSPRTRRRQAYKGGTARKPNGNRSETRRRSDRDEIHVQRAARRRGLAACLVISLVLMPG